MTLGPSLTSLAMKMSSLLMKKRNMKMLSTLKLAIKREFKQERSLTTGIGNMLTMKSQ